MSEKLRIVAAVVDTAKLTIYKEDGTTLEFIQGDVRVRQIIDQATLPLSRGEVAEVTFAPEINPYVEFEKKSSGLIKFFRVAKDKIAKFFNPDTYVQPVVLGSTTPKMPVTSEPKEEDKPAIVSAIDEIMKNAIPVAAHDFHERDVQKQQNIGNEDGKQIEEDSATHTVIAVVGKNIVPGVEKVKNQIDRAAKLGSTKGVEAFLTRLANVKRQHSINDLLKFMERGDLPIADDGCIIIYKVLQSNGKGFVDCHTRRVEQKIGSYVFMSESLVDHNRHNECSNGLHVARRQYINGFNGDVCVIAKVKPEDVIAVPNYDANKMRVCGYHILHQLTPAQHGKLKRNESITNDADGKSLLGNILAGIHPGIIETVEITQGNGGGLKITPVKKQTEKVPMSEEVNQEAPKPSIQENVALPEVAESLDTQDVVDPKEVAKQVTEAVKEIALTKKQQALAIYARVARKEKAAAIELVAFKKAAKKSWDGLGLTNEQGEIAIKLAAE